MVIAIDMDGTVADLYNVPSWLDRLRREDAGAYRDARPLVDAAALAQALRDAMDAGARVEFVTWGSKGDTSAGFERATLAAKRDWLDSHGLPYDALRYARHGTSKSALASPGPGVLIDDEAGNREEWTASGRGPAYPPDGLLRKLADLTALVRATRP